MKMRRFNSESSLRHFVRSPNLRENLHSSLGCTIGVNLTLTHLKRIKARKFFSFDQLIDQNKSKNQSVEFSSSETSSVKTTLLNELHEKLNEALSKLSDKHRTIVVLFEIDGLSHKEIASIMKCTEGTVRSRLHYAKVQLQSLLSEYVK